MWTYSTNCMGPYGLWWYEENNIPFVEVKRFSTLFDKEIVSKNYEPWFGGRIDCYCDNPEDPDYDHYHPELGLPIMDAESYHRFSTFLDKFKSCKLMTFRELKEQFEEVNGFNLNIHKSQEF